MPLDWLVVASDHASGGRGVRGQTLAWFLRTYLGRRRVGWAKPADLRSRTPRCERLLIGLPTSLAPDEISSLAERTGCRRLAAFDYHDQIEPAWTAEQAPVFCSRGVIYLKPWREPRWNYGLPLGMLPLRRYGRFTAALAVDRLLRRAGAAPRKKYDVAFLGRPNRTRMLAEDGSIRIVEQRTEWIRDLRREAPEVSFWGGLVGIDPPRRAELERTFGDVADLLHSSDKVSFPAYWRVMRESRVLLAPGGNVPWSYRHYECLYAGAVVATIDFRQREMLVPLPIERMVHVPDGESALPAIREALESARRHPEWGEANVAHLEQYFRCGAYSRRRPLLYARFLGQFA